MRAMQVMQLTMEEVIEYQEERGAK